MIVGKLVVGGRAVAECERTITFGERLKGLIGRRDLDGAMWFEPANGVHTMFMRFPIEVAFLDARGNVVRVTRVRRWHTGVSMRKARSVVEAQIGQFEKWGIAVGSVVAFASNRE